VNIGGGANADLCQRVNLRRFDSRNAARHKPLARQFILRTVKRDVRPAALPAPCAGQSTELFYCDVRQVSCPLQKQSRQMKTI
jgi:hypothetical protein